MRNCLDKVKVADIMKLDNSVKIYIFSG